MKENKQKIVILLFYIIVISFFFHIIWENVQAPLYGGYESFFQHFWPCFWATWWDVSYTITLYLFMVLYTKNWYWFQKMEPISHIWINVIGFVTAAVVEHNALLNGKWGYTSLMPIVPLIAVGLTPFVQLVIGMYVVIFFLSKIFINE